MVKAREKKKSGHEQANMSPLSDRRRFWAKFILPTIVFCWPVLYLFNHVFTIDGKYTAIGNDFIALYYRYKIYLLAGLAEFHLPLWSPSEAAGFPFYSNPFAQAFYPLNLLLVVWYKIFGGFNPLDYQLFTVLGISIFALGLFMWLRLLNTNPRAALFAALVMSVSFRMTEITRFPHAVHTAAWYPWILYAMTKIILSTSWKKTAQYGILLTFFFICLLTGGYPYYIYYTIFLFGPYLLVFLIKPLSIQFIDPEAVNWKRALSAMVLAGVVAVLICSPYLFGCKQLISQTTDRGGTSFAYSTEHTFTFEDTIGSLMYPPAAMEDGWNFFSITALLIIFLYLLRRNCAASAEQKGDLASVNLNDRWIKLFLISWIGIISYISYGRDSYLFIFLWKYMPGFSALRVWPRLNIVLVPILAWLALQAYASFESVISGRADAARLSSHKFSIKNQPKILSAVVALAAIYMVILGTQLYLYLNKIYDPYWLEFHKQLTPQRIKFIVYGAAGFASICTILLLSRRIQLRSNRSLAVILFVLLATAVLEMRPVGTHIWTHEGTYQPNRFTLDIPALNKASFQFCRIDQSFTIALNSVFSAGIIDNWYFNRYVKFLRATQNELPARRVLLGVQDGTKVFFSESIKHETIVSFLHDAGRYLPAGSLLFYNGDELRWEIQAPAAGYLSFIDNWDSGWKATVDGEPAEIELLFGTFKSVKLTPGLHRVQFKYQPGILFH